MSILLDVIDDFTLKGLWSELQGVYTTFEEQTQNT